MDNVDKYQTFDEIREILEKKKVQLGVKRAFDITASLFGILALSPILIVISFLIKVTSKGPIFFKQVRVGRHGNEFRILKFRTMIVDAEKKGLQITVGNDSRITKVGHWLRKSKLDELPQLFNVLNGDMSIVGPRPEVIKYVDLYSKQQRSVLLVRPGITDIASIKYRSESEILSKAQNPEEVYINEIMVSKLNYNMEYIRKLSLKEDIKLIVMTLIAITR